MVWATHKLLKTRFYEEINLMERMEEVGVGEAEEEEAEGDSVWEGMVGGIIFGEISKYTFNSLLSVTCEVMLFKSIL